MWSELTEILWGFMKSQIMNPHKITWYLWHPMLLIELISISNMGVSLIETCFCLRLYINLKYQDLRKKLSWLSLYWVCDICAHYYPQKRHLRQSNFSKDLTKVADYKGPRMLCLALTPCQKSAFITVSGFEIEVPKKLFQQKCAPKLLFFNEKKSERFG